MTTIAQLEARIAALELKVAAINHQPSTTSNGPANSPPSIHGLRYGCDQGASNGPANSPPSIQEIIRLVAANTGVPVRLILTRARGSESSSDARHLAIYLAHHVLGYNHCELATHFQRDHTSILYSVRRVDQRMGAYPEFKKNVQFLLAKLSQ